MKFELKLNYFMQMLMSVMFFVVVTVPTESKAEIIFLDSRPSINFADTYDPAKAFVYVSDILSEINLVETVTFPMPGHAFYVDTLTNNSDHEISLGHIAYFPLDLIFPSVNFTHVYGDSRSTTVTSDDGYSASITDHTPLGFLTIQMVGALSTALPSLSVSSLIADYYIAALPSGWSVTFGYEFGFSTPEPGMSGFIFNDLITSVPEPEIYGMLLAGLALIGFLARRQKAI
jgi:hypothetical protein